MLKKSSSQRSAPADVMRDDVRPGHVVPLNVAKNLKARGADGPLAREAITVDRNRWMLAFFGMFLAFFFVLLKYMGASEDARENVKLMYVKMYGDGTWSTEFFDSKRGVEFVPATIDSLLVNWSKRCFQEDPATVGKDYGYCRLFMDAKTAGAFVDPKQGNAIKRAAEIRERTDHTIKEIAIRTISHFDSEKATFGREPGAFYRTNIFVQENIVNTDTGAQLSSARKILTIRWRLMTKNEIQATARAANGQEWLHANPIGLQVLGYQYQVDPDEAKAAPVQQPISH